MKEVDLTSVPFDPDSFPVWALEGHERMLYVEDIPAFILDNVKRRVSMSETALRRYIAGEIDVDKLYSAVGILGNTAVPLWLAENAHHLSDKDLAAILPSIHCSPNIAVGGNPIEDTEPWLALWRRVAWCADDDRPQPRQPVRLFRGAKEPFGVAWSSDVDIAKFFLHVFDGKLFIHDVPSDLLLGYVGQRNESEYIVDWQKLQEVPLIYISSS